MSTELLLITFSFFLVVAFLYSSVGHGGASGYLAVLALLSLPIVSMKSNVLILNIVVSGIASFQFIRAGYFDRKIFLPFACTSLPAALLGSMIPMETTLYKTVAGIVLIIVAFLLVFQSIINSTAASENRKHSIWLSLAIGLVIGFISGLVGIGGGIFLSPLLLLLRYTNVKNISGISALFILCNSLAGLMGHLTTIPSIDSNVLVWIVAVILGGSLGSFYGVYKFPRKVIISVLVLLMLSAGIKMVLVS